MTERLHDESLPVVPKEELLAQAEQLFSRLMSAGNLESRPVNLINLVPTGLEGNIAPEIEAAVKKEFLRAHDKERERVNSYNSQLERQWRQRSLARRVLDIVQRNTSKKYATVYNPQYDINDAQAYHQETSGQLPEYGKDDWPTVTVLVTRTWYEGDVAIAGQTFTLDPDARSLSVTLGYQDDEGNRRLFIRHSLLPYLDGIRTKLNGYPCTDMSAIPFKPFTEGPADSSVFMKRAMEMLTEAKDT